MVVVCAKVVRLKRRIKSGCWSWARLRTKTDAKAALKANAELNISAESKPTVVGLNQAAIHGSLQYVLRVQ